MNKLLIVVGGLILVTAMASASEQSNAMAVVSQFVDDFNRGDAKMLATTCADDVSIVDDSAPYHWSGSGGCSAWEQAYEVWAKQNGVTKGVVTLRPRLVEVTGDQAYVVVWATSLGNKRARL